MDRKRKNALLLAITLVLVIGSVVLAWPPDEKITQGLDIKGGLSVILTAESTSTVTAADMQRAVAIVNNRVDSLGALEASIQRQGSDSILVQIPGIADPEEALKVLGSTGQLEFVSVGSITDSATVTALQSGADGIKLEKGTYEPFLTGEVITSAGVSQDPKSGQIVVDVTMNDTGAQVWGEFTSANIGQQVAIVLDGIVQSAPVVNTAIPDGKTQISGNFTVESAKHLKTVLESGALPVSLVFSESRVVGPTLGQDSLRQGVFALALGLGLIAVFMLVVYRGLGIVSVIAMAVFGVIFVGSLAVLSHFHLFSLSLPGIAGVVLTVGMAADSSVLILERYKEEVWMGKTVRTAADSGTWHGVMTSVDADLVTLVSGLALYVFAVGPVRGFAFTLMLGVICDFIMMLLFKRPLLMTLADKVLSRNPALWGISVKGGGADA
ncbi:MAG: protein translocase subunit SecD [Coriobacteriia bacterium]|nr:protein translocase subunit SecD [Coriobacteriia bacterium]